MDSFSFSFYQDDIQMESILVESNMNKIIRNLKNNTILCDDADNTLNEIISELKMVSNNETKDFFMMDNFESLLENALKIAQSIKSDQEENLQILNFNDNETLEIEENVKESNNTETNEMDLIKCKYLIEELFKIVTNEYKGEEGLLTMLTKITDTMNKKLNKSAIVENADNSLLDLDDLKNDSLLECDARNNGLAAVVSESLEAEMDRLIWDNNDIPSSAFELLANRLPGSIGDRFQGRETVLEFGMLLSTRCCVKQTSDLNSTDLFEDLENRINEERLQTELKECQEQLASMTEAFDTYKIETDTDKKKCSEDMALMSNELEDILKQLNEQKMEMDNYRKSVEEYKIKSMDELYVTLEELNSTNHEFDLYKTEAEAQKKQCMEKNSEILQELEAVRKNSKIHDNESLSSEKMENLKKYNEQLQTEADQQKNCDQRTINELNEELEKIRKEVEESSAKTQESSIHSAEVEEVERSESFRNKSLDTEIKCHPKIDMIEEIQEKLDSSTAASDKSKKIIDDEERELLNDIIKTLEEELKTVQDKLDKKMDIELEFAALKDNLQKTMEELDILKNESSLTKDKEKVELVELNKTLEIKLENFQKKLDDKADMELVISDLTAKLDLKTEEMNNLMNEIDTVCSKEREEIDVLNDLVKALEAELKDSQNKQEEKDNLKVDFVEIEKKTKELNTLRGEFETIKMNDAKEKDLLDGRIKTLESEKSDFESEIREFGVKLEKKTGEFENLKFEIQSIKSKESEEKSVLNELVSMQEEEIRDIQAKLDSKIELESQLATITESLANKTEELNTTQESEMLIKKELEEKAELDLLVKSLEEQLQDSQKKLNEQENLEIAVSELTEKLSKKAKELEIFMDETKSMIIREKEENTLLNELLKTFEDELKDVQKSFDDKIVESESWRCKYEASELCLKELTEKESSQRSEIERSLEKVTQLEGELDDIRHRLSTITEDRTRLENELDDALKSMAMSRSEQDLLISKLSDLDQVLQQKEHDNDRLQEEMSLNQKNIQAEKDRLLEELCNIEKSLQDIKTENDCLSREVNVKTEELQSIELEKDALLNEVNIQMKEKDRRLQESESKTDELLAHVNVLNQSCIEKEKKIHQNEYQKNLILEEKIRKDQQLKDNLSKLTILEEEKTRFLEVKIDNDKEISHLQSKLNIATEELIETQHCVEVEKSNLREAQASERARSATLQLELKDLQKTKEQLLEARSNEMQLYKYQKENSELKIQLREQRTHMVREKERGEKRILELENNMLGTHAISKLQNDYESVRESETNLRKINASTNEELAVLKYESITNNQKNEKEIAELKKDIATFSGLNVEYDKLKKRYLEKRQKTQALELERNQLKQWCEERGCNMHP